MPSVLGWAYEKGVPVYVPAFTDSELGLDVATFALHQAGAAANQDDPDRFFAEPAPVQSVPRSARLRAADGEGEAARHLHDRRRRAAELGPAGRAVRRDHQHAARDGAAGAPVPLRRAHLSRAGPLGRALAAAPTPRGSRGASSSAATRAAGSPRSDCDATIAWPILIRAYLESVRKGVDSGERVRSTPFTFSICPGGRRRTAEVVILPLPFEKTVSYGPGDGGRARGDSRGEHPDRAVRRGDVARLRGRPPDSHGVSSRIPEPTRLFPPISRGSPPGCARRGTASCSVSAASTRSPTALVGGLPVDPADLTVVQIDAHGDLIDRLDGVEWCHGTVMRRLWEQGVRLVQVGVRSVSREEHDLLSSDERIRTFFAHEHRVRRHGTSRTSPVPRGTGLPLPRRGRPRSLGHPEHGHAPAGRARLVRDDGDRPGRRRSARGEARRRRRGRVRPVPPSPRAPISPPPSSPSRFWPIDEEGGVRVMTRTPL